MVLFDDIIELLDLQNVDQSAPAIQHLQAIHVKQTRFVGPALVDIDLVRSAVFADGSNEERGCACFIATFGQHEIKGCSVLVDCSVEIRPLALYLDIGLICYPAGHCAAMAQKGIRQDW